MASPVAWLHRVAMNEANRHFRRLRARDRAVVRHGVVNDVEPVDVASAVAIRAALRQLPDRQRAALLLHYIADLPVCDVAGVMNAPEGTVKSLLFRGRAALRHLLDATGTRQQEVTDAR